MKNINEFATEYAQDKYLPVQTSQAVKAGANAVLKEIEHFAESTWGASSLNTISLKKMIKELKGE